MQNRLAYEYKDTVENREEQVEKITETYVILIEDIGQKNAGGIFK